jgi:glycosyltransferase involved in cell wall biosynthesis
MPAITALLHTRNDSRHLGRALESLRPCDEILVIDHGSLDNTPLLARQYGAVVHSATASASPATYLGLAHHPWVLCLLPCESLTEALEASLFEWKLGTDEHTAQSTAYCFQVREETANGWIDAAPVIRLIPKTWTAWQGTLPVSDQTGTLLEGHLLRFRRP